MPGPHVAGINLAISVAAFANLASLPETVRGELMNIAGTLTKKAYEEQPFGS
jgi:hypothetical protein